MAAKETDLMFNQRIAADILGYWLDQGQPVMLSVQQVKGIRPDRQRGAFYAVKFNLVDGLPR